MSVKSTQLVHNALAHSIEVSGMQALAYLMPMTLAISNREAGRRLNQGSVINEFYKLNKSFLKVCVRSLVKRNL